MSTLFYILLMNKKLNILAPGCRIFDLSVIPSRGLDPIAIGFALTSLGLCDNHLITR